MKDKAVGLGKRIVKHELINGSFYIFLGSIIGSLFSLVFNLFLARKLTYADYGILQTLISFIGLVTIPTQSITTVIVQYATNYFSKKEYPEASYLYKRSLQVMSVVGVLVFLLFTLFSHALASFLHISNVGYILLMGVLAGLGYVGIVNNAFLQSLLRFGFLSVLNFLGNLSKITFGIILVLLGFKTFGVLFALIITGLLPIVVGFFPLRFLFGKKEEVVNVISKRNLLEYAILVAITTMSFSSLISTDLILVKHFFNPSQAGLYAGLSQIGKSIFYLTAPISTVLFPVIINRYNQGKNFVKTFYLAIALVSLPSFAVTIFYFLFPQFTIQFFLGGRAYLQLAPLVWLYGLFITIFSMLNVCVTFFLSLKKTRIAIPLSIAALSQIIGITLFHKNFFQVISVSLLISSVLLIVILLYYLKSYGKND